MKALFYSFLVLVSINSLSANTLIVTDVDDTVKVTDVLNKKNAVYNALFSKAAFSGMPELYREMNTANNTFYYLSGSPTIIEEKVSSFLEHNNFPQSNNLILKKGIKTPTYDYKVAAITNLISKLKPTKIILIGDDTEYDPEVYATIHKNNPGLVDAIYIRAIRNKELPKIDNIKNFFSAAEIAGHELLKGEMSLLSLGKVATAFVKNGDGAKIFIKGRYCPSEGRAEIDELKQKVSQRSAILALEITQQKIISTCKK